MLDPTVLADEVSRAQNILYSTTMWPTARREMRITIQTTAFRTGRFAA